MTAAERVDAWCEKGIFGLMLAILAFGPPATGAVRTLEFLVIQGLVLTALLVWLVRIWASRNYRLYCPPLTWVIVAFALYAVGRTWHADLAYVGRGELVRVLLYAIVFLLVLNNLHRQGLVQLTSWVLVFLGLLIAAYAIYQFATDSPKVWHFIKPPQYLGRGSGTYICPNHLAGFLGMLIPLGLTFAIMGRMNPILRLVLGYASLVMFAGVIVSLSLGGWFATGLSLLLLTAVLVRRRARRIPLVLAVMVMIASTYTFVHRSELVQRRAQRASTAGAQDDFQSRIWLAVPTVRMWLDHPWFGVGPDHFDHRFPAYRPVEIQVRPGRVHNDFLNVLADWGLAGGLIALIALGVMGRLTWTAWRYVRRDDDDLATRQSNRSAFLLGASIGLFALAIHSLTDFNLHVPANAILAVTLAALLASHLRYASSRHWYRLAWPTKALLTLVLLSTGGYLGRELVVRAREHHWLAQAAREKQASPARIRALERAVAIEPTNFNTTHALGELCRQMSWQGYTGYRRHAATAIEWYERGLALNPYDPYNPARIGMCLDWLGDHERAAPYYEETIRLDPNNHYLANLVGWHYVQMADWPTAKKWFERSLEIKAWGNWTAERYLRIVSEQLVEPSTSASDSATIEPRHDL
jgi:O-antigen ligase